MKQRIPRIPLAALAALALATGMAACGGDGASAPAPSAERPGSGKPAVTIGTRISTEQLVLGQLYRQALEARGFTVELKQNIGSPAIAEHALRAGEIDLYPEFEPVEALAVTPAFAREHELESIADLRRIDGLRLGARPEFLAREDGLAALQSAYGLAGVTFAPLTPGLQYGALDEGQIDAALVTTTDGTLHEGDYVVLADPQRLFGDERGVTPVIRADVAAEQGTALRATLGAVGDLLTVEAIRELNAAVDLDGETPADVARAFLDEHELAGER